MPDDTTTFQKAGEAISHNRGKLAVAGGGGLSIGLAMMLFASKAEVAMLKDWYHDDHRLLMDLITQRAHADASTNSALHLAASPERVGP